jgi:hypothetical protein
LLQAEAAGWSFDEKDEVEIAVADLLYRPILGPPAKTLRNAREAGQVMRHGSVVQDLIALWHVQRHLFS